MTTIVFFAVLAAWAVAWLVLTVLDIREHRSLARLFREQNNQVQGLDKHKARLWDICVDAARRGEEIPQSVFLLGIRKPTAEEIEHGKLLDGLASEAGT